MDFAYSFFPVEFTKEGTAFQPAEEQALLAAIKGPNAPTDLFIMCHGWNNNMDDAKDLYSGLAGVLAGQIGKNPALAQRSYAICGILWPSKKFEDKDLIPSGAAALNDAVTTDDLKQRVRDLQSLYEAAEWPMKQTGAGSAAFGRIQELMDQIEDDPAAQREAADLLRSLLPQEDKSSDDASDRFFTLKTDALIRNLSKQLMPPPRVPETGAAALDPFSNGMVSGLGGAAGFRDLLGGVKSGFLHLLNFATYYTMKARAGDVGVKGIEPLIEKIRAVRPDIRLHLIGHSFGCRALSAAVNTLPAGTESLLPDTMMLLQGAFSHNGFAVAGDHTDEGAFRSVLAGKKVRGPILISHTRNDKAVGIAYAIASRLSGVTAAALGDENDIYGGLGSNGTQTGSTTKERVMGTLLACNGLYPFASGAHPSVPYNLKADQYIKSHSDVVKPEAAYALAIAMAAATQDHAAGGGK